MRLLQNTLTDEDRIKSANFSSWLLNVGDGKIGEYDKEDPKNASWITIPEEYLIPDDDKGLRELISFIYDKDTLESPSAQIFQDKAIVCPKNETVDEINKEVLSLVKGETKTYLSSDEVIPLGRDGAATELLYPPEYLNTLKFTGLPPSNLTLKVGTPIMLIRNINLGSGLCNGTRMIVTQLLSKLIEAEVITSTRIGKKVFIPRIPLTVKDPNLPFIFKRKQFPVKMCYAMTINKSQGQSLKKIGIYLPELIFGHGQLYVALSRSTTPNGLKILIKNQDNQPPNKTKNIVYKDFLKTVTEPEVVLQSVW